jgi:abequosyltransferase
MNQNYMNQVPRLSICIPTYNRAKNLETTIKSIVNQKRFQETDDVEIIISDNCSTDNTRQVVEKFLNIYQSKIRYYYNDKNIDAANIYKVLSYGNGLFLKLNNDTLVHLDKSLDKMINFIDLNEKNKNILYFSNESLRVSKYKSCNDLNSFVKVASFYSTWIACFGIWKSDMVIVDNFETIQRSLLINDVLFQLICKKKVTLIDNSKLFNSVSPTTKGGYNLYKIFVSNYIGLLEKYHKKNEISKLTLFNEKAKLFLYFLVPWTLNLKDNKSRYFFEDEKALSIVFKKYAFHPVFYIGSLYFILRYFYRRYKKTLTQAS